MNLNDKVVLIVDDSPDTLGMLNDVLEKAGMTTLVALEGSQAIKIAEKMTPDVILMDAVMPRQDGFETCKKIKTHTDLNNIPVIFMTGLTDSDSVVKAFQAGGVDYVSKPVNINELIERITVHLDNVRVKLSVQSALDVVGFNVCAVSDSGELQWATPAVRSRLEALHPEGWVGLGLQKHFSTMLSRTLNYGDSFEFSVGDVKLNWNYMGKSTYDEQLFQYVNIRSIDEIEVLTNKYKLTKREAEVVLWISKGKTNREAAQILDLSPRTINKHLEQAFKKIGVENRTSAAAEIIKILNTQ